ncbi:MAG: hypothetical protein JZU50_06335 [Desulfobulbaceae bacterium]|nr:hypothetical protein [Desulfobulbaceae bacterium]
MTISSIGSSSYYAGQLSTMRNRAASEAAETTGGKEKPTLAQLFTKLDADGSGSLESTEVQSLTEKISEATGISVDLAEFFSTYDADSDGALSQDEAVTALEANRPQGPPPPMGKMEGPESDMVSSADVNGDGIISAEEAEGLVSIINQATGSTLTAEDLLSANDSDKNGTLSTDEAVTALEANRPQGPPPPMGKMEGPESDMVSSADVNGDGIISAEEAEGLVSIINQANGSTLTAEDLLSSYDSDDDGTFSTDEAVAALEANRPQGPPPSDGGTAETEEVDALTTAAIEKYLEMAALGMGQQASGDIFSMFGDRNGSVNDVA